MELSQEEKAAKLQYAVINSSVEELCAVCDALGDVEMSAPALGLACRFRGLAVVRALAERGITFDFPSTGEIETKYRCYIGQSYANYRTNYALYLLKIFRGGLKGACSMKGMKFAQNAKREAGKPLPFLADDERTAVLDYLLANQEKLFFQPGEMLFYAIYARDTVLYEALKKRGVTLPERRIQAIAEGGAATDGYWYEYGSLTGKLADGDYLEVMQRLALELGGKPFYFTEKMLDITRKRFQDIRIFTYFLTHFRQDKMKKYQILRGLIDENVVDALPVVEREGWLASPNKRDEMIAYATQKERTEVLAWLLDFKNRTADFAAEQEKADKKMMRELNRSLLPDSVTMLKKIWSYRKQDDGTLVITNYKGNDIEVTVPEKIGKSIVTAIGDGAFAGFNYGQLDIRIYATREQRQKHCDITKITLPGTIRRIGTGAFVEMNSLREIAIPEGVEEIGEGAFYKCASLKHITVPGTVKKIGKRAFLRCRKLERVYVCDGVSEIGDRAFLDCSALKTARIPQSVQNLRTAPDGPGGYGVFNGCKKLTVHGPKGSDIEKYCREMGILFEDSAD